MVMKKRKVADIQPDPVHVIALKRAITIAGGQAKLAEGIARFLSRPSVSQQTVSYWVKKQIRLEAEWWPAIEHVTNGEVTGVDLRPDVFKRSVVLANHVG